MDQELFKSCKLVVSEKVPDQNEKLREYITDKLDFKIARYNPLTIEKENVTCQDWQKLTEVLKAKYSPEEVDSEHSNQTSTSAVENMRSSTLSSKHVSQAHSSGNSYKQNEDPSTGQDVSDAFCKNKITSEQPVSVDDLASTFCGLSISHAESTSKDDADLHNKYTSREDIISKDHEVSTVAIATPFGSENIKSDLTRASKDEIIIERQHHIETGTSLSEKPIITQKQDIMTTNTDNKEAGSNDCCTRADSEETRRSKAGVACMLRSPEETKRANSSELNSSKHDEIHAEDSSGTIAFSSKAEDCGTQLRTQKAVKYGSLGPTINDQIDIGTGNKFSETQEAMQMNDSYKHVTDEVANSCKMKVDVTSTEKNENVGSTLETSDISSKQNISSSNDENMEYDHNSNEENRLSVRNEENTNSQNEAGHCRLNISKRDDKKVSRGCREQHDVEDELRKMSDEEMAKKPAIEAKELQKNIKHFSNQSSHEEIVSERPHIEQTTESSRRERDLKTTPQKKENQLKKLGAEMQFLKGQEKNFSKATHEGQKSVKCETQNKEKIHERQKQMEREKQMESNKHKTGQSAKNKSKQHSESEEDPIETSLTPDMNEISDYAEETQETERVCVSEYLLNWTEEWNFECAKRYMNAESYKSFFKNAERKDAQVTFRLDMNDPKAKSFLKLVKQLKFAKIGFNNRDKEHMKRLARELTLEIDVKIEIADTFFMIVGLKEAVSEAKMMIMGKLQSQDEAEFRSSENMHMQEENNMVRSRQMLNDRPNKVSRYEYEHMHVKSSGFHNEHLKTANLSTSELSKNQFYSSQRSQEQGSYQRGHMFHTEIGKVIVVIQNADITTFKADCIVNAANKRLQHRGGVAKAIAVAAGEELMKDCEDYIKTGKTVGVTDIFVSKSGRLPAKFVFHAVGPMWDAYDDKKRCLDDLRCTVLRCLVEAARQGMSSIALPSISAAIFKVPKELCARCYMEAVKHFDIFSAREGSILQEIYFIDVDDIMVNYIIECFLDNWEKPSDREMLHRDLAFAENHIRSTFQKMSSDYTKPKSSVFSTPSGANETTSSTGAVRKSDRSRSFQFGRVTLHLKSGHAFDYSAGITITVGKPFDKLSGLTDFQIKQNLKHDDNMPCKKNKYEFFNVSKPYGKQSRLLLTTYPEPYKAETFEEIFQNLEMAIQSCDALEVQGKIMSGLIITSSLLYAEPKNQKQKGSKKSYDQKRIGSFSNFLHKYMVKASRENKTGILLTVVGSEDALPIIEKVMDSRITQSAPGAYPSTNMGGQSTARSEGSKSGSWSQAQGEKSAQSQYDQTRGERSGSGRFQYGQNQGDRYRQPQYDQSQEERSGSGRFQYGQNQGETFRHGQNDQTQGGNHDQNPPDRPQSGPRAISSAASSDDMPGQYHHSDSQRNSANSSMNTQNLEHSNIGTSVDQEKVCGVCFDDKKSCQPTSCCGMLLCLNCERKVLSCPFCRKHWQIITGDQPDGTMTVFLINDSADGYEGVETWKITYYFPSGTQKAHHPSPGKWYRSVRRTAYLPNNKDGFDVLLLLRLAFIRRLTFTIGHSRTKNEEDVITWNDIHHKTSLHGGIFGYPDPMYISRVRSELASKGVKLDTLTESENRDLDKFCYHVTKYSFF